MYDGDMRRLVVNGEFEGNQFTPHEGLVLETLLQNPDEIVSYKQLDQLLYPPPKTDENPDIFGAEQHLRPLIVGIRENLEVVDAQLREHVQTVRAKGFRYVQDPSIYEVFPPTMAIAEKPDTA